MDRSRAGGAMSMDGRDEPESPEGLALTEKGEILSIDARDAAGAWLFSFEVHADRATPEMEAALIRWQCEMCGPPLLKLV